MTEVTRILAAIQDGDERAIDRLLPIGPGGGRKQVELTDGDSCSCGTSPASLYHEISK